MNLGKKTSTVVSVLLLTLSSFGQNAADSIRMFKIETADGNIYTGSILSEDENTLILNTENLGELRIRQTDVVARTELKGVTVSEGKIWLPNPQSSRYFWSPNGYGLEKGNGYYQNIWVLYNQFSIGITDYFSFGGGILPLFLFAGTSSPVWIVPKLSLPVVKDKVNIGTGALLATVVGEDVGIFGLIYETTTFGSRDMNVSIGFAYGFAQDTWMSRPVINLSAMVRTGPKGYFITENFLIPYDNYDNDKKYTGIISLGGRSIFRNVGLDYSLWIPLEPDMDNFIAIPFLGLTLPIRGKKAARLK